MIPWRASFLKCFLLLLFFGVVVRLFYWQVVKADTLQAKAESEKTTTTKSIGQRGSILFSDGSILVASQLSYLPFVDKKNTTNQDSLAKIVAPLLEVPEASISAKLSQNLDWIPLAAPVSVQTKDTIEQLHLSGIGFDRQERRLYPEASMAANVLGFVGKDDAGKDKGYFGLEGYYNRELSGNEGFVTQETDVFGSPILTAQAQEALATRGNTLVLNIDRTIQFIAEQKLKLGVEKFHAKSGDIVIMDPNTGGILAMASYPTYEPATYYKADASSYPNPIVSDTYEPGSTFKTIVMASAIDAGAVKPDSVCPCTDEPRKISGSVIHNWDNTYRQNETMSDIVKNSDNNGMIYVGEQLGRDKLYEYLNNFGIGKSTNIDLEDEQVAQLRPKDKWYPIDYATATFGQGIAVTPIQLVRAEAAIANGGKLLEPHVVKKIITSTGEIDIKPKVIQQVITEETSKKMTQLLEYVVENSEAKRLYKPAGFWFAGKTGTAQVAIAGHYDSDSNVDASYIGFGPADNPKFVMLVRMKQPVGGEHGALTAEPVFYDVAKELFAYWGITPTQ